MGDGTLNEVISGVMRLDKNNHRLHTLGDNK